MNTLSIQDRRLDSDAFSRARNLWMPHPEVMPQEALRDLAREVIARLGRHLDHAPLAEATPSEAEIEALCDALVAPADDLSADVILKARREGMSIDMVCLGLIASAARRLGDRWDDDRITFVEMTLAASRMYGLLRGMRDVFTPALIETPDQIEVCFASVPGETHTLGVTMAADVFRRRGWRIDLRNGYSHGELVDSIGTGRYAVIGISAGSARMLPALIRLKVALRVGNPRAWIMICGKITEVVPDLSARVDADLIATDVHSAIEEMQSVIDTAATEALRRSRATG